MAAPTVTARSAPAGLKLRDGYSTKIAFKRDPDVSFWERTVTPPGVDGGDEIDITTMHNSDWRTFSPRQLVTLTESTVSAAYDPALFSQILDLVNFNDEVTVHFPDGSTLAFWGFLKNFEPGENTEGEFPEATITIVPTNMDNSGAEQAPVLTSVAGT